MSHDLEYEKVPKEPDVISGNRIVELGYVLKWAVNLQYEHSKICTGGQLYIKKEITKNKGLTSSIIFNCTQCDAIIQHDTEDPNKPVSEINYGAVWGAMATGSTCGHLEELCSCLDIPSMSDNMFYDIENKIGAVSKCTNSYLEVLFKFINSCQVSKCCSQIFAELIVLLIVG